MKATIVSAIAAVIICLTGSDQAMAQSEPLPPTTRILAIGTFDPAVEMTKVKAILPDEVRETVNLYLAGKIDQWFSLQERPGVVFVLNETDAKAAEAMLEQLPLGRAHLMKFQLIPLGPLVPLRQLQGMAAGSR